MPAELSKSPVPLAEISQGPNALEMFLDRNQKNLIVLTILVALGAAALVIYRGIEKSRQESAGAALSTAENMGALQAVIKDHAGTVAASSTMVLLAEHQWTEGQQDAAIETLRKFIASNADHAALATAQASLGSKLMIQGKSSDATRIFQELSNDPKARFVAPFALISLGDISKMAGDFDKADESYKRVKTEFSESAFAETAKRRLATLKAKPPVEIDAPPVPKAEIPAALAAPAQVAPVNEAVPAAVPDSAPPAGSATDASKPEPRNEPGEKSPATPQS